MLIETHFYETEKQVAIELTKYLLKKMQESDRPFYLAISGGSTPNLLYSLWGFEYATAIPWQQLHLFWVDERCVPPTDPESNFGNMKKQCLDKITFPEENLHRIHGEAEPALEAERYAREVENIVPMIDGIPQFDMILAGMGEDGHTSSIFPGQTELLTERRPYAVSKHPDTQQARIAMTGPTMMAAKELIFLVIGKKKLRLVNAMLFHFNPAEVILPALYISKNANKPLLFSTFD
jgi:6-phosphogluconolactonase